MDGIGLAGQHGLDVDVELLAQAAHHRFVGARLRLRRLLFRFAFGFRRFGLRRRRRRRSQDSGNVDAALEAQLVGAALQDGVGWPAAVFQRQRRRLLQHLGAHLGRQRHRGVVVVENDAAAQAALSLYFFPEFLRFFVFKKTKNE